MENEQRLVPLLVQNPRVIPALSMEAKDACIVCHLLSLVHMRLTFYPITSEMSCFRNTFNKMLRNLIIKNEIIFLKTCVSNFAKKNIKKTVSEIGTYLNLAHLVRVKESKVKEIGIFSC